MLMRLMRGGMAALPTQERQNIMIWARRINHGNLYRTPDVTELRRRQTLINFPAGW